MLAGVMSMLSGIGVLGYEAFLYLKNGLWPGISVLYALQQAGNEWALHPTDWYGLYKLLDSTPLSVALFVSGVLAILLGAAALDSGRRY